LMRKVLDSFKAEEALWNSPLEQKEKCKAIMEAELRTDVFLASLLCCCGNSEDSENSSPFWNRFMDV
jgi:hypothetical protein